MSSLLLFVHNALFVVFVVVGMLIVGAAVKSLFTKKKVTC